MTRFRPITFALAAALTPLPASAALCAVDTVPAASLLVPYFELDLATACSSQTLGQARDTEFWFHNTSDESTLSHVTLWSQAGIPALDFLVYQQGRETHHVSLRDLFCQGRLPRTGPGERDTSRFSTLGTPSLPYCSSSGSQGTAPMYPPLTQEQRTALGQALTGQVVPAANGCYAPPSGDQVARGYITIDVVQTCAAHTPADPAYYDLSTGSVPIDHANVLVGGFLMTEGTQNIGYGAAAIALEAAPAGRFGQDDSTFYGRYHGYSGVDRREPLPSTWMVGLAHSGTSGSNGEAIVWREVPKLAPSMELCAGASAGGEVPLEAREQRLFDPDGHSQPSPQAPPAAIPLATQRLPLSALESTSSTGGAGRRALGYAHLADGTADARLGQAWLGALVRTEGRFGDLVSGIPLDSRCATGAATPADTRGPTPTNPNVPGYFWADGFED